jgi:small-conductance mechanosensitive channel
MSDERDHAGPGETADSRSLEPWAVSPDPASGDVSPSPAECKEQEALAAYERSRPALRADLSPEAAAARERLKARRQAEAVAQRQQSLARLRAGLHRMGKSEYTEEEADLLIEEGLRRARQTNRGITP